MSATLFWGHSIGVDYDTLSSGDGVTIPVPSAISPTSGEVEVLRTTNLTINVTNPVGAVITSPLTVITVLGVIVWSGDAGQNGWIGVKNVIAGGFQYILTPPSLFIYGAPISVNVYAENDQGIFVNYPYSFFVESSITPYANPAADDTTRYSATDIMFPFVFQSNGDVPLIHDTMVVEQNMRLGVLINKGGIPLKTFIGSRIIRSVLEANSDALKTMLGYDIVEAVSKLGLDVVLSKIDTVDNENELNISAPYRYMRDNKGWKTLQMSLPVSREVT